jgi:Synapsin, ATP binding domain
MEIIAVDALHGMDGKDYIIELNVSAIGLLPDRWIEDTMHIIRLVQDRLDILHKPENTVTVDSDEKQPVHSDASMMSSTSEKIDFEYAEFHAWKANREKHALVQYADNGDHEGEDSSIPVSVLIGVTALIAAAATFFSISVLGQSSKESS